MTDQQLKAIADRNRQRRELKAVTTPGPWCYDAFACVVPPGGTMIAVRTSTWWNAPQKGAFSDDIAPITMLDSRVDWDERPVQDAQWIAQVHEDPVEDDVDALLQELQRLRALVGS